MNLDITSALQRNSLNVSKNETFKSTALSEVGNANKSGNDATKINKKTDFDKSLDRVQDKKPYASTKTEYASERSSVDNKVEKSAENKEEPKTQDKKVNRKAAMEVFMQRMQEELGIPPEQILKAFSELSEVELASQPELSAASFVDKLGLDTQKSMKALDYYNEMLAITAAAGMAQFLANNGSEAQFQVMDKKQSQLQSLQNSITDMSERFFMNGSHAPLKMGVDQQAKIQSAYGQNLPALQNKTNAEQNLNSLTASAATPYPDTNMMLSENSAALNDQPLYTEMQTSQSTRSGGADIKNLGLKSDYQLAPENIEHIDAASVYQQNKSVVAEKQKISTEALSEYQNGLNITQATGPETPVGQNMIRSEVPNQTAQNVGPYPVMAAKTDLTNEQSSEQGEGDLSGQDFTSQANSIQQNQNVKGPNSFIVGAPQITTADVNNNVQEIISKAQFLAQKGGGEMKVTLTPEGLGEVNLKVNMVNGNVNVEMITESSEAKKILEKGLSELKDNLASHRLNLDSIKIENSKESSAQMDQRQQDLERGMQQRFLGDFQQRNNNFRREMYEFASPNMPTSQTRDKAMNANYDPKTKRKTESTRRLDLVA